SLCQGGCPYTFKLHGDYCYRIFSKVRASWFEARVRRNFGIHFGHLSGDNNVTSLIRLSNRYIDIEPRKRYNSNKAMPSVASPQNEPTDIVKVLINKQRQWHCDQGCHLLFVKLIKLCFISIELIVIEDNCLEVVTTSRIIWSPYLYTTQISLNPSRPNKIKTEVVR
ncbi:Hypothetical predicted protein, partial [Mytilus galloprovincialis]